MARWILENPQPAPRLAHTIVASWWPTRYYMVGTIEYLGATSEEPMKKLIRSIPGTKARDEYIVQVFKCNRSGVPKTWDDPYYERSYGDKQEALGAHREVVRLLSSSRLRPLRRSSKRVGM
jgi:hypothetical protein